MQQLHQEPHWKTLYIWGSICLAIFIFFQILPSTSSFFSSESKPIIKEKAAEQKAADFVREQFNADVHSASTVYMADRDLYGYLAKEKLTKDFDKQYSSQFPTETYQVNVRSHIPPESKQRSIFVHVNMESGEIVGWNAIPEGALSPWTRADSEAADLAARSFLQERGFRGEELKLMPVPSQDGSLVYQAAGYTLGDAKLFLHIDAALGESQSVLITRYKPQFQPPEGYVSYVEKQDQIAGLLTLTGYIGMSVVLFILAIIYAILYRRHTSFARGWLLAVIFFLFYTVNNINMMDGVEATLGEIENAAQMAWLGTIVTTFIMGIMAVSVYISLVAGDGLWRGMGRNLWPRWGESGYGDHVWTSMKTGYWIAFIFLGLQTLIFLFLEMGTGAWATTDVSQSPINFAYPWLFPILAWCAAISEEAIYRLFGIAVFKRWFRSTYAAVIIPTIVWALGHVAYPIYPWTTRLVELTLLGLLFCFVMLRYGFIAALFAHAVIDLVLMAVSLVFMGSAENMAAAVFYILHPIALAWLIRYLHNKRKPRPGGVTAPHEAIQ
ncbi:CPBP family intramembrane glutamic endopeptidase [Paenibacillus sambharensis]|nr:CPBP family intramembrane glutamic endopeptidase [Paenibacillus sambharensis]